ncbi:MAG TPA: hypothetical protein PLW99_00720, partial [Candidatus Paceibacterota bacterium]|nr:hypothetical protein [Candidatus Paceibacterota bacterium]
MNTLLSISPVLAVAAWLINFSHKCAVDNKKRKLVAALKDFVAAAKRFDKWREERPRLRVSQSWYARSLVHTMIDSYTIMLRHGCS